MFFFCRLVLKKIFFSLFSVDPLTEALVDSGNDGDQSQEDFDQVLAAKEEEEEADLDSESRENDDDDDDGEEKAATASVEGKAENVFFEELLSQPEPDRPEPDALRSRLALTAPETVEPDFAESDQAESEVAGEEEDDDDDVESGEEDSEYGEYVDEEDENDDEDRIFVRTGAEADSDWPVVNYPKAMKRLERAAVVARKKDSKSLKKRKKSNPRNPEDQRYIDFLESNRADIVGLAKDGFNDMGAELQRLAKLMKKKDEQHAADMAFIRDQLHKLQQTANVSQARENIF